MNRNTISIQFAIKLWLDLSKMANMLDLWKIIRSRASMEKFTKMVFNNLFNKMTKLIQQMSQLEEGVGKLAIFLRITCQVISQICSLIKLIMGILPGKLMFACYRKAILCMIMSNVKEYVQCNKNFKANKIKVLAEILAQMVI